MSTRVSRILEVMRPKRRWFQFSLRTLLELTALCAFLLAWYLPRRPGIIQPGDYLDISVIGTLIDFPIDLLYVVEYDGKVLLGPAYGRVDVAGITAVEAEAKLTKHLKGVLRNPEVAVRLVGRGDEQLRDTEIANLAEENRRLRRQLNDVTIRSDDRARRLDALLDRWERRPAPNE